MYQLDGFYNAHQADSPSDFDFSALSHEAVFHLLSHIFRSDEQVEGLTPEDVWNYFGLHSLDDAVDDFEIYVYDVNDHKYLVCRLKATSSVSNEKPEEIWSTVLPRYEFLATLEQFLKLFPDLTTLTRRSGRYQEGDLLEIPLPDGRVALGWLLQVFRQPKDLASFVILGIQGDAYLEEVLSEELDRQWPSKMLDPFCTTVANFEQLQCTPCTHHAVPQTKQLGQSYFHTATVLDIATIQWKIMQAFQ